VCSSGDRLSAAAEQFRAAGAQVVEISADRGTRDGIEKLWKEVTSSGRDLDIACINAGGGGLFAETELEKELAMANLNCTLRNISCST
jgi:uncharacterized protein